ncbi:Glutathione S-transferase [Castilleja foliolosa]|uniref:glutathione transferase n=1 Tax=Castilleja foliolosa TaxID=1961234 RepID=A0ABD3ELQ9_9LAMI
MAKSSVKLLGVWASPFSLRAQIALNLKSIDYEFIVEDFVNKSQLLIESNPVHKKVPVLIHDGKPVCESLIIVQYIDDVWTSNGPSFLPSDPYERATALFWAAYIENKIYPFIRTILYADGDEAKMTSGQEEANQILGLLENTFTNCSKGKKFFGGEKIGYVDIALGSFLAWIRVLEKLCSDSLIDETKTPNLFKWAQEFCDDDAVKDVLPETEKLLEFANNLAARVKNANSK